MFRCLLKIACNKVYQTDFMEQSYFYKLIVAQLVKKFPAFYGNRRFIVVLT
jgi:hypothetical protein